MTNRLGPASEKEILTSRKLIVQWDETVMEWGIYRKNDYRKKVLRWIGSDEQMVIWCQFTTNVKLPEELQVVEDRMEAEKEVEREAEAEREKIEAEAEAERREKYLESLSEEDREDVLERERERERNREDVLEREREWERIYRKFVQLQEKREYERMPEPGKKRKVAQKPKGKPRSILDILNAEPEEVEEREEPEEVFPWEKEDISQD